MEFEVQRVRRNNKKKNEKRRQQQNAILGEAAAELNLTLAHSPISIKSEDLGTCGSAAQSPVTSSTFGVPSSPRHPEEKVSFFILLLKRLKNQTFLMRYRFPSRYSQLLQ